MIIVDILTESSEVCSDITLTHAGVTSDSSGLADLSTYQSHGMWRYVKLKVDKITQYKVTKTLAGNCGHHTYRGWTGRGSIKYGTGTMAPGIAIDLSCDAQFRVCGTQRKAAETYKRKLTGAISENTF